MVRGPSGIPHQFRVRRQLFRPRQERIEVTDFDAAHAALKAQGVTFVGEPYWAQTNRLVFFTDGDGNFVHLIQREKPLP
jgi:hypothetical protein